MKSAYEEVQENNSWSRVHMCAVKGERDSQALTSGLSRVSVFHVQAVWNHRILTIKYSSKSRSAYGAQGHNKSQRCIWCRFCQRNTRDLYADETRTTNNPEFWSWIGIIAYPNGDLQWCDCTSGPFQVRSRRSNFPPWGREKYHVPCTWEAGRNKSYTSTFHLGIMNNRNNDLKRDCTGVSPQNIRSRRRNLPPRRRESYPVHTRKTINDYMLRAYFRLCRKLQWWRWNKTSSRWKHFCFFVFWNCDECKWLSSGKDIFKSDI